MTHLTLHSCISSECTARCQSMLKKSVKLPSIKIQEKQDSNTEILENLKTVLNLIQRIYCDHNEHVPISIRNSFMIA